MALGSHWGCAELALHVWAMHKGQELWHSPVSLLGLVPLSLPSLLGSLEGQCLLSFLKVHPFQGGLEDQGGPCLLACHEVPWEDSNSIFQTHR